MTHFIKTILLTAVAASIAVPAVQASPYEMTGNIVVSGSVAFNTGSSGNATQLMGWYGDNGGGHAVVQGANGHFVSYAGAAATSGSPWNFGLDANSSSALVATSITDFLSVGGMTFYLSDWKIQSQVFAGAFDGKEPLGALTISGTGYVSGADFLTTFGTWIFSTVDADGVNHATFSFVANRDGIDPAPVPDGGSTVALLGFVIGALALLQRRFRSAGRDRAAAHG